MPVTTRTPRLVRSSKVMPCWIVLLTDRETHMRPLPFSFSSLSTFINCPRRYHAQYVLKVVKDDPDTPHLVWGNKVHKAFEDRQRSHVKLPPELAEHEEFMARLATLGGEHHPERKIAFGAGFANTDFFCPGAVYRGVIDHMVVGAGQHQVTIVDYKGLPLDTLISTPSGFTTMGDVQVGDMVHGSDGAAYPVTVKSQVSTRPCFEVVFDDKTRVVCDNVHLWPLKSGAVVPVTELVKGNEVQVARPVQMPEQHLPIDPYVLGVWLADGKHTSGEVSKPDQFIWDEVQRRGYEIGVDTGAKCPTRTIKGIRGHLATLGVMRNKHIPEVYLNASVSQRLDLLRGLMDGDGSANHVRSQAVFCGLNRRLVEDVQDLVASLGERGTWIEHRYSGFGRTGTGFRVVWRPIRFVPFLLPRKAAGVGSWGKGRSEYRRVVSVTPAAARETACIGVASPDNTYLCTRHRIVTHNTGKRNPKWLQLKLNAIWAFNTVPKATHVEMNFYWTQARETDSQIMTRDEWRGVWKRDVEPDLRQYVQAFKDDIWQPRRSGLCKAHCPVLDCEHNGRGAM